MSKPWSFRGKEGTKSSRSKWLLGGLLLALVVVWGVKGFKNPFMNQETSIAPPTPVVSGAGSPAPSPAPTTAPAPAAAPALAASATPAAPTPMARASDPAFQPGTPLPPGVIQVDKKPPAAKAGGAVAAKTEKRTERKEVRKRTPADPNAALVRAPAIGAAPAAPLPVPPPAMLQGGVASPEAVARVIEPDYLERVTLWMDSLPSYAELTKVGAEKPWTAVNVDPCRAPACTLEKSLQMTPWPPLVQRWFLDAEKHIPPGSTAIVPGKHPRPMWGTWGRNAFVFHPNVVAAWASGKPESAKHWWVTVGQRGPRPQKVLVFHVLQVNACSNWHGWVEEASVPPAPQPVRLPPQYAYLGVIPQVECP